MHRPKNYKYDTTDSYWWPILDSQKMSKACSFIAWTGGVSTGRESTQFTGMRDNWYLKRTLETFLNLYQASFFRLFAKSESGSRRTIRIRPSKKTSISLKHNISAFVDPNPVPLIWLSWVRIRFGNVDKINKKPEFQLSKWPLFLRSYVEWSITYIKYIFYVKILLFVTAKSDQGLDRCALWQKTGSGFAVKLKRIHDTWFCLNSI